jgi:RNA polymerase sigma factor (sigma-70 family)
MTIDRCWEELNRLAREEPILSMLSRQDSYGLLRRYVGMLVRWKSKGSLDFENITDEIIKIIFDNEERFDPARGDFTSWVGKIALNQLRNEGRKAGRRNTRSLEGIDVPVKNVEPEWAAVWIDLMEQLPNEIDRQILIGRYQRLTTEEIADTLGMKASQVESRWSRILNRLNRHKE